MPDPPADPPTDPPPEPADVTAWSITLAWLETAVTALAAASALLGEEPRWAGIQGRLAAATTTVGVLRRDLLQRMRQGERCVIGWGACPDHGATLATDTHRSWCTAAGCGRRWGYDRVEAPCLEPATARPHGAPVCAGHDLALHQASRAPRQPDDTGPDSAPRR